jgi:hypothetical protein
MQFTGQKAIWIFILCSKTKWSQFRVNRADKNNRKGLELTSNSSFNFRHLGKECVEISYFDFDLKNNIVILWTENLISDTVH